MKTFRNGTSYSLLSGLTFAFIMLLFITFILSIVLRFSAMKESNLDIVSYFVHFMCILIGGWMCGKRVSSKGWYYGGMLGVLYSTAILLIAYLAFDSFSSLHAALISGVCFTGGAIGGMIGVNSN
ncbi:TIGR04086 family membrane protein [Longirhabdus pacifica]|uniref:TIGR04086 family membrane protein n=1 Tax=Longirhabdus pacifica TaxID=2305227 RepID=UPI0010090DD2|nr:TIGR04086 family membrane protein [Longirhabdus pacifica]